MMTKASTSRLTLTQLVQADHSRSAPLYKFGVSDPATTRVSNRGPIFFVYEIILSCVARCALKPRITVQHAEVDR